MLEFSFRRLALVRKMFAVAVLAATLPAPVISSAKLLGDVRDAILSPLARSLDGHIGVPARRGTALPLHPRLS